MKTASYGAFAAVPWLFASAEMSGSVLCFFIRLIFARVIANAHNIEPIKDNRAVAMYQLTLEFFKNAVAYFTINHIVGKLKISTTH